MELPELIACHVTAQSARRVDAMLAAFTDTTVVRDEGIARLEIDV